MENIMITVPLGDFVDGVRAITDLESVRALVQNGDEYCSNAVMSVLGIESKEKRNPSART